MVPPAPLAHVSIAIRSLQSSSHVSHLAGKQERRYHGQSFARRVGVQETVSYIATSQVGSLESSVTPTEAGVVSVNPTNPLSILPFSKLARSFIITSLSSSPLLLKASLGALKFVANTKWQLFSPDRNPIIHFVLKKTAYAQFCAGENAAEVSRTIADLKSIGFKGVMLCYAREVSMGEKATTPLVNQPAQAESGVDQIATWAKGTLDTVKMAQPGDFVSIKMSGAGPQVAEHLSQSRAPPQLMSKYLTEICELARARQVKLAVDAEQNDIQTGIDDWTMDYMKQYNRSEKPLLYCTYQAYKKTVPSLVAEHLQIAAENNFTLGVKLVRGAYLWSDPRSLFWDNIEDTHRAYDGIAAGLIEQKYNDVLKPSSPSVARAKFPTVGLVLAGHNANSVRKARELHSAQAAAGEHQIELAFGQLMGMAEHISCDLVRSGQLNRPMGKNSTTDVPQAYQYLAWGSVGECSQYLVRRAEENQDAVTRTFDARKALGRELFRRLSMPFRRVAAA